MIFHEGGFSELLELFQQISEPPALAEMLSVIQEIDPSATVGVSFHDGVEILCSPDKAQACTAALKTFFEERWIESIVAKKYTKE